MSVLRVYDPAECDDAGVPLDWQQCRACEGNGRALHPDRADDPASVTPPATCPNCNGHGSLRAAALHERWRHNTWDGRGVCVEGPTCPGAHRARCEDCGHPMSEGTWEGGDGTLPFVDHDHPQGTVTGHVHYSPCDEGCGHRGHVRRPDGTVYDLDWEAERPRVDNNPAITVGPPLPIDWEASWRPVDVRTLGWPHDLRAERLAVLCLRCWAART